MVLVGFSYGGFVVTGALEHIVDRVRHLVYLDAFVPEDGDTAAGLTMGIGRMPVEVGEEWLVPRQSASSTTPPKGSGPPLDGTPHPAAVSPSQFASFNHWNAFAFDRTYIKATLDPLTDLGASAFVRAADHARRSPEWRYCEIETTHMVPHNRPKELAAILLEFRPDCSERSGRVTHVGVPDCGSRVATRRGGRPKPTPQTRPMCRQRCRCRQRRGNDPLDCWMPPPSPLRLSKVRCRARTPPAQVVVARAESSCRACLSRGRGRSGNSGTRSRRAQELIRQHNEALNGSLLGFMRCLRGVTSGGRHGRADGELRSSGQPVLVDSTGRGLCSIQRVGRWTDVPLTTDCDTEEASEHRPHRLVRTIATVRVH